MPDLEFAVVEAEVVPFAAGPTMLFKLAIRNENDVECIHSIMLRAQIRIETAWRQYDGEEEVRLRELFGVPSQWGETLRSMLWMHAGTVVQRFTGRTTAELPIACTYDFEVASAKYFHGLHDGDVPLIFLFSGTIFYADESGMLQIAQIPWEKEARFRLPVKLWKEMMDRYFPNSAWLRLQADVFDRLYRYRIERGWPTWEMALEDLLSGAGAENPGTAFAPPTPPVRVTDESGSMS